MNRSTRSLTRAAMIAALYVVLTMIFQPISFGAVQFRISELLTLLPILTVDAIPGLLIGCLLSNLLGGAIWFDVVFGTLATFLAAVCTYRLRSKPIIAAAMPVLFNGLIVGPVVYFGYIWAPGTSVIVEILWTTIASVAAGEAVVCMLVGLPLGRACRKLTFFQSLSR